MSDPNLQPEAPSSPEAATPRPPRRRARLGAIIVVAVLAAGAAIGIGTTVLAQGPMGWGHGRMGGWHGPSGMIDPARVDENVERMVKHFAVEIDATSGQQTQLTALAKAAAKELLPLREKMHAARTQAVGLLAAPTVDRAAAERLRAEQFQIAETFSKRITQLLTDTAEVLTPDQRKQLAERIEARHKRFNRG